ncbi:MAG: hypothetical protein HY820_15275 [Acidobacteria bacterium]|nr:hypothetical protein [Acidobacteriota bacterium]
MTKILLSTALCFSVAFAASKEPPPPRAKTGVKTPGVQIPFAQLKTEARIEIPGLAGGPLATDAIWVGSQGNKAVVSVDLKENKISKTIEGVSKPCGQPVTGFGSLWVADCDANTVVRMDAKNAKVLATIYSGIAAVSTPLVASSDSVWVLSDTKTSLVRIDPGTGKLVSELRLPQGCAGMISAEEFLWVACPADNRVLRVNPVTNLIDKTVDTPAKPRSLAFGDSSVWAYCDADGKLVRIDPKTQKITQTIELNIPNGNGEVAFGEGMAWVSATGFPITRIDPSTNAVAQQFYGDGHGMVEAARGSIWIANASKGVLLRLDPKRIQATLAE